jgi:myo-inositol-1(or 4)-monophosphatase
MNSKNYLDLAIDCALKAGAYLKTHFNTPHTLVSKSHINDLVTECDQKSENLIKDLIKKHLPESSFICEESGRDDHQTSLVWIIDPLDGTVNFVKKIPFFCVSIALTIDNIPQLGVIYNPLSDELFYAQKGQGAFLNHNPIHVSCIKTLEHAFGALGFPYLVQNHLENSIHPLKNLLTQGVPLRRLGSAALDLAYLACGRFDLFFEAHLEPWDYSAGGLIVQEAGGRITNYHDQPLDYKHSSSVVATNTHVHSHMIDQVNL